MPRVLFLFRDIRVVEKRECFGLRTENGGDVTRK